MQTKTTGKEQMIKTYGERAACRSACMDFRGASMQLQLYTLEALRCKTRLGARFWAQNRVLLQSSKIGTCVSRFQCVCVAFCLSLSFSVFLGLSLSFSVFVLQAECIVSRKTLLTRVCVFSSFHLCALCPRDATPSSLPSMCGISGS